MGSVIDCPANDVWTDFGRGRELVMSTPTADEPCRVGFVKIWIYQNISVSFLLGLCTYNSSTPDEYLFTTTTGALESK